MVYNSKRGGKDEHQRDQAEIESVTKGICGYAENTGGNHSALGTGMQEATGLCCKANPG